MPESIWMSDRGRVKHVYEAGTAALCRGELRGDDGLMLLHCTFEAPSCIIELGIEVLLEMRMVRQARQAQAI